MGKRLMQKKPCEDVKFCIYGKEDSKSLKEIHVISYKSTATLTLLVADSAGKPQLVFWKPPKGSWYMIEDAQMNF